MKNKLAMKTILSIGLLVLSLASLGVGQLPTTKGDYSPAVVARDFQATYGIRTDAVQVILAVYQQQGLTEAERKSKTEDLIKAYRSVAPKTKGVSALGTEAQQRLGIIAQPGLVAALNWDMFAQQYYLSTSGANSPAIVAAGDVSIWYGIPEPALRTLATRLEANAVELGEFGTQLQELAEKYEALKKEFETYGPGDPVVRQAEKLLDEGRLEEAEMLLESDYRVSKKRLAYKAYLYGKTKELLLKYEEAAEGYRDAVSLDSSNVEYVIYLCTLLSTLGNPEESLGISQDFLHHFKRNANYSLPKESDLLNIIGVSLQETGNSKEAASYFERSLTIDSICIGMNNKEVGTSLNNLSVVYGEIGEYQKAIQYAQKAIAIFRLDQSSNTTSLVSALLNLSATYCRLSQFDVANNYSNEALALCKEKLENNHPHIALAFYSFGSILYAQGEYQKAKEIYETAYNMFQKIFPARHPYISLGLSQIAICRMQLGQVDEAIIGFNEALLNDTLDFPKGHGLKGTILTNIGAAYYSKNDLDNSIKYSQLAIETFGESLLEDNPKMSYPLNTLGLAYCDRGEKAKAIVVFEQALAIDSTKWGTLHTQVAIDFNHIGSTWMELDSLTRALQYTMAALRIDSALLSFNHPNVAIDLNNIGAILRKMGQADSAIPYILKALEIDTVFLGYFHPTVAMNLFNLGITYSMEPNCDASTFYLEEAIKVMRKFQPRMRNELSKVFRRLSIVLSHCGQELLLQSNPIKARPYFQKALQYSDSTSNLRRSLTCLLHIAKTYQQLSDNTKALCVLDTAINRINNARSVTNIDTLASAPDSLVRQVLFYRLGSLKAVGRKEEFKAELKQLKSAARAAKDQAMLDAIKEESWKNELPVSKPQ
jgi:tetratricopeptide (TPR) repeat protein